MKTEHKTKIDIDVFFQHIMCVRLPFFFVCVKRIENNAKANSETNNKNSFIGAFY